MKSIVLRDTSLEINHYPDAEARYMLEQEPDHYWYGSDYPAQLMVDSVQRILRLGLSPELRDKILFKNSAAFFGI